MKYLFEMWSVLAENDDTNKEPNIVVVNAYEGLQFKALA